MFLLSVSSLIQDTVTWCHASHDDPKLGFTSWMSSLIKQVFQNMTIENVSNAPGVISLNQWTPYKCLVCLNHVKNITAHLKTDKATQSILIHLFYPPAFRCIVICICQFQESHRGLSTDASGRNRCLIYRHICWSLRGLWSRSLRRASLSVTAESICSQYK